MIRELIQEVVGLSPYEKRLLDMLKTGGASSEKRMYKYAKRRVSFNPSIPSFSMIANSSFLSFLSLEPTREPKRSAT
jgi:hypothetical protein